MKHSLKAKLILSYLAVALITVLVVSVFIRLTSGQSLMNMVAEQETAQLKEAVQSYYTTNKTLDGFFDAYIQNNMQIQNPPPPGGYEVPPVMRDIRGIHGLVDTEYRTLIPMFGFELGVVMPEEMIKDAIPVEVDGETVAWILPDKKFQFNLSKEEQLFLQRTTWAIAMAALAGVLVAVAMGFLLAGGMLKPIRRLTAAAQSLAHGDLQQQVPVTSQDELGLLTSTFNQMSTDLAEADQKRKRMTADITHDLSTPLQIISGYMELLEDGEVTLSPQRIDIIKTEIEHLRRLVGDLTTLTQAEAGGLDIQIHPVHPGILMERIYQAYQPICARQGVELVLDIPEAVPAIQVDEGRMMQVLKNLVENALRYTPGGGRITLAVQIAEQVELKVIDGGSGIEPEDLPYVFDRFFRADKARGANSGKMGLGLAICKALVTAQGGTILAESAGRDQGTTIVIRFPSS
ncbi:MAG TPA: ATP-binding protein [Anaerolineaceae bacterium]|nr:ATP-binding protein [Anaerolineaceae bacterium]HOD45350.1 ATP-binding protein [Anaerolineaceae bacterium]